MMLRRRELTWVKAVKALALSLSSLNLCAYLALDARVAMRHCCRTSFAMHELSERPKLSVQAGYRPPSVSVHRAKVPKGWMTAAGVLLVLFAGLGGIGWWASRHQSSVRYTTSPVTRGPVVRTVTATGTVNPVLTILVGTYVSGVIQSLYCDYNTKVRKGQICAKIDPRLYQAAVDQYEANLAVARAQLEKDQASLVYAKLSADRNAHLAETKAVSQDTADNTKSVYEQMRAQTLLDQATIGQIQAQLDAAHVNLEYTDIISPVDGTVVSRNVTQGQTVAASFQTPTLLLIATDLAKMQVDTNVSESDFGGIRQGNQASFTVDAFPKRTFEGVVTQVRQSPQTVQNVVTYDVVVSIDNSDQALAPGMTASTSIVVDRRSETIRVPDQALRYVPGGLSQGSTMAGSSRGDNDNSGAAHVWILREGAPVAVPVLVGLDDNTFTEVLSGDLKPGDQVIISEQRAVSGGSVLLPRL